MKKNIYLIILILCAAGTAARPASQPVSSIRGTVIDADSKIPLVGVSIVIVDSDPAKGTIASARGEFRFEKLPVGRYNLEVLYLGYESKTVSNILLGAGKESVLHIELTESLIELDEVVVRSNPNHFSEEGATGGPISMLNSTTLDNSNFFPGAFSAEYGNAYSGVFDIKLLNGNDQEREYILQAGILGFEGAAEGPFVKGKKAPSKNKYIQSAILNGEPLMIPWINHEDLINGGILVFEMGPKASKIWGAGIESAD